MILAKMLSHSPESMLLQLFISTLQVEDYSDLKVKLYRNPNLTIVMFYVPWCEHYHTFKPEWTKFQLTNVTLGEVNCMLHRHIC